MKEMLGNLANKSIDYISLGLNKFSNCGFIRNQIDNYSKDRGGYVAKFLVVSNCLKDAVGGYFYVKQSLENKKIPEERRGFVAALDLTNSVLMIGTQIILGFSIAKPSFQNKIKEKLFGFLEDEKVRKVIIQKFKKLDDVAYDAFKNDKANKKELKDISKSIKNFQKNCGEGFEVVSTVVAATIIAKRAIVPFISTPLAGWVKTNFLEKGNPKQNNSINKTHQVYSYPGAKPLCGNGCSNYLDLYKQNLIQGKTANKLRV